MTALDPEIELGGFAFDKDDEALAACVDDRLNWLTNDRRADPLSCSVQRLWNATEVLGPTRIRFWPRRLSGNAGASGTSRIRRGPNAARCRRNGRLDAGQGQPRIENVDAATDPFGGGKWRQTRGQVEIGYDFPIPAAGPTVGGISIYATHTTADVRKGRSYAASDIESPATAAR